MTFVGFDMLAEPPAPPAWLERWYRDAAPRRSSFLTALDSEIQAYAAQLRLDLNSQSQFIIPLKRGYRTPPEIDRRVRQRALDREARR